MQKLVIGIDVSKETLDLCLKSSDNVLKEWVLPNVIDKIKSFFKCLLKEHGCKTSDVLVCAEYTGQYTYPLGCACDELGIDLWLENPAQIKHSSGIQRGKNDKLDARKISSFSR